MFAARSNHYVPLLEESHSQPDQDDCGSPNDLGSFPLKKKRKTLEGIPWTLVLIILCTLLNVTLSLFPALFTREKEADTLITRQNIHLLRRPNQYIGFDDIPRPSPPVSRQLSTYPILLSLVDAAFPETVFEDDFAMKMVHGGTITPDDRRVRATPTMSTIIQFRAIDWGMETCELHVDLPEAFGQGGHSGSLAVYRLSSTIPLDTTLLSYSTRPSRIAKLGEIPLGKGVTTWHRKFHCTTDDVLSFELGCLSWAESAGDSNCFVEWVQIKDAIPAIHMVQYSTA